MAERMKAVVVSREKGAWELQDRELPQAGPGQVLVRIHACGICGTDLWLAHGTLKFREFPLVLGHEGVGEVVAVGEGVTERQVGDPGHGRGQHPSGHPHVADLYACSHRTLSAPSTPLVKRNRGD